MEYNQAVVCPPLNTERQRFMYWRERDGQRLLTAVTDCPPGLTTSDIVYITTLDTAETQYGIGKARIYTVANDRPSQRRVTAAGSITPEENAAITEFLKRYFPQYLCVIAQRTVHIAAQAEGPVDSLAFDIVTHCAGGAIVALGQPEFLG